MILDHIQRVRDGVNNAATLSNLSHWIARNTFLDGKKFSFKDHEFQQTVIDDPAKTINVVKIAQVGLSEIFARWGIAACTTQENFTLIWTFPSSNDAEKFCKARLDPLIAGSPEIRRAISSDVNSMELKQFGLNSFCYIRGTMSETGALSVPADMLIHDEFDRSDMGNIAAYISRLQHKPTKILRRFSTPTVEKFGISKASETSKRKREMWTCSCCNHKWLPSYFTDIHIPGFSGAKKEITKFNIKNIRYREAVLLCPKCGRQPDPGIQHREWVFENASDNYDDITYFISPFSAPAIITPSYLVHASTQYEKWSEFVNQGLGLTSEESSETLTNKDVVDSMKASNLDTAEVHGLGVDLGLVCHLVVSRLTNEGKLIIVRRVRTSFTELNAVRADLIQQYKILPSVHDLYPYTDLVKGITDFDPNAYAALFEEAKTSEPVRVRKEKQESPSPLDDIRISLINRNVALDELMWMFKRGDVAVAKQEDMLDEDFVAQMLSMKRVQKFDRFGGIVMRWEKTDGNDHFHNAALYSLVANKLMHLTTGWVPAASVPLVTSFKNKSLQ